VVKQENKMKILAYELDCDTHWEPGVPHNDHPDYWELRQQAYRSQIRQDGFFYDLEIDKSVFPDFDELGFKIRNNPLSDYQPDVDIPNPIVLGAWFEFIEYLDYPCIFQDWPIMSPQMLETIRSVGDFRHCTYSTLMEDMKSLQDSNLCTGLRKNDFVIVQTLEFLDAYDWEKSEYKIDGEETKFTKLVLKEPIPSLFRLVGDETRLYVSAAVKEALEVSDTARGARFSPIDEEHKITLWNYKTKFNRYPVDT
jgi:hypothetical protein